MPVVDERPQVRHQGEVLLAAVEVVGRLLRPLSLTAVLEEVLNQVQRLFGYPVCGIFFVDQASHELHARAWRGFGPQTADALRVGITEQGFFGRAVITGRPCYAPDTTRSPLAAEFASAARACAALPLRADDRVIGLLSVGALAADAFPEETRRALEAFATLAALAILRARRDEELRRQAMTDGLTDLANRRAVVEALRREIARAVRFEYPVSVVVVEIDKFKRVNDRHGHLRGDEVLRAVGDVLRGACRQMDLAARSGGDEFVILLPYTSKRAAARIAERARRRIEGLVLQDGIRLTASLGVASIPDDGATAAALFDAADQAMYEVKHAGGNRVGVSRPASRRPEGPSR